MSTGHQDVLHQLRDLDLGPDVEAILSLDVPPAACPLLALIQDSIPPGQAAPTPHVLDHMVEQLVQSTSPGGDLDPQVIGTDIAWVALIALLLDRDPAMARQTALRWVRTVDRMATQDHVASAVVAAVAAYSVAAAEEALGRPVQARRWMREADALVECEGAGVSSAAWVRAQVLLGWGNGISRPLPRRPCGRAPYPLFMRRSVT